MTVVGVSIFENGDRCEFTVADANGNQVLVGDRFLPMVKSGVPTVNPNSPDSVGSLIPPSIGTTYKHIRGIIFQDENGCAGGGSFSGGYEINPFDSTDMVKAPSPPTIFGMSRTPDVPNANDSVLVTAEIISNTAQITSATLYYTADQSASRSLFSSVSMSNNGSTYTAKIPKFPLDSVVRYYISASDDSSRSTDYPFGTEKFYTVRANGMTIMDIQKVLPGGNGSSPYVGDTVTVSGFATSSYQSMNLDQLYIQDTSAKAFAGIFVNGGPTSIYSLNVGDEVVVEGIVEEYHDFTRIQALNVTATNNSAVVKPIVLDPSNSTFFQSKDTLEKYEGMLLRYENPNGKVNIIDPDLDFGEFEVGSGKNATVGARILTGRPGSFSSVNVSVVSDTSHSSVSNLKVPAIQADTSQYMDAIIGVLNYGFNNFKLTPRSNADLINFSKQLVAVDEIHNESVNTKVYPNPTKDKVIVQLDEGYSFEKMEISIFDISGREVIAKESQDHFNQINLSGLEKGIYILRIMHNGEMINTSKLILK